VIDEAHHSVAQSYKRVIKHYTANPALKVLGVTATPDRADQLALGQIFQTVAHQYEILNAIEDGWLVPIEQQRVNVRDLDFSHVRTTAGDLNGADLAAVMEDEKILHRIATPTIELAAGRKTLVFASSVRHAERLCEIFNRHKPMTAEWICGRTPRDNRRRILRDYRAGKFQILVNVGVFTEGYDEPSIQVVAMARPTKSRCLYAQMAGRGLRPIGGLIDKGRTAEQRKQMIAESSKPKLVVLDFVGNSGRHKLMSTADILGGKYSDEVVERAKKNIARRGYSYDLLREMEEAEREIEAEKIERLRELERRRRRNLVARVNYTTEVVDPFNVYDIKPWRSGYNDTRRPTARMEALLRRFGIDPTNLNFTQARQLIGVALKRAEKKLCTYKQARILKAFGYDTENLSREDATRLITAIAENGWRRPAEVVI